MFYASESELPPDARETNFAEVICRLIPSFPSDEQFRNHRRLASYAQEMQSTCSGDGMGVRDLPQAIGAAAPAALFET